MTLLNIWNALGFMGGFIVGACLMTRVLDWWDRGNN